MVKEVPQSQLVFIVLPRMDGNRMMEVLSAHQQLKMLGIGKNEGFDMIFDRKGPVTNKKHVIPDLSGDNTPSQVASTDLRSRFLK